LGTLEYHLRGVGIAASIAAQEATTYNNAHHRAVSLCGSIQHQFRNYQIHFVAQRVGSPARSFVSPKTRNCHLCCKKVFCVMSSKAQNFQFHCEEIRIMRARPQLHQHLVSRAMQKWALIGRHPSAFPNCPASRARRNFARLLAKYPQIGERLGLNALSAYPPL
jgi:hypothetical protein